MTPFVSVYPIFLLDNFLLFTLPAAPVSHAMGFLPQVSLLEGCPVNIHKLLLLLVLLWSDRSRIGEQWPTCQIWSIACVLYSLQTNSRLYISKELKYIKRRMLFYYTWKLVNIQILISISKFLLEHSHIHLVIYFLWLLLHYHCRV